MSLAESPRYEKVYSAMRGTGTGASSDRPSYWENAVTLRVGSDGVLDSRVFGRGPDQRNPAVSATDPAL